MSQGLDRLPGHAYAPGMEPGWTEIFGTLGLTSSEALLSLPTIALAALALMMFVSRAVGFTGRPRAARRHARHQPEGRLATAGGPGVATILSRTLTDRNFDVRSRGVSPDDPDEG